MKPLPRFALALVSTALLCSGMIRYMLHHPGTAFLFAEGGAAWIQPDVPPSAVAQVFGWRSVHFSRRFEVPSPPPSSATVSVRALREYRLWVNDVLVDEREADTRPWRASRRVDVAAQLRPGLNDLTVEVRNDRGPPALLVHAEALDLVTGGDWHARSEGRLLSVVPVTARRRFPITDRFGTSWGAFASTLPFLLAAFGAGALASLDRRRGGPLARVGPGHVRVALLVAWAALAFNNVLRVPLPVGMDIEGHYKYILHIVETGSLPVATEGWQNFQAPLFYLLSALLVMLLDWLPGPTLALALRALPLLCGLAQVEVAYRTTRLVFPKRASLQMLGTLVAGLLPMNLYISQVVGNEPLAGLLGAVLVYRCLALLLGPERGPLGRLAVVLGALLGLALLSKSSALLLLPVVALTLVVAARDRGLADARTAAVVAASALTAAAVAGWFFAWTWFETGSPLLLSSTQDWWQEPGFRTPAHFLSFGAALDRPIYASIEGFWDSLYSSFWLDGFLSGRIQPPLPPWNYSFVLTMAPLSLPMTLAGLAGALGALRGEGREGRAVRFAAACVALYATALLFLFAIHPVYSVGKSTYTLALLPCYGLLIAAGLRRLPGGALPSALASGYVGAWAFCAYAGYWVLPT